MSVIPMKKRKGRLPPEFVSEEYLTFRQCIDRLRDGRAYIFTHPNLAGYFYKAPSPADPRQTDLDGAASAITYYDKETHQPASPTLMLYDFDEANWSVQVADSHPLLDRRPSLRGRQ